MALQFAANRPLFFEEPLHFKQASQPTDIIWENRHISRTLRKLNRRPIKLRTILMLALSILIVLLLQTLSGSLVAKYPQFNCSVVEEQYGDSLEWFAHQEYGAGEQAASLMGQLSCFCERELAYFTKRGQKWKVFSKKYSLAGQEDEKPLCVDWYNNVYTYQPLVKWTTATAIVVVSFFLKTNIAR